MGLQILFQRSPYKISQIEYKVLYSSGSKVILEFAVDLLILNNLSALSTAQ